jgi:hypothetical protein
MASAANAGCMVTARRATAVKKRMGVMKNLFAIN